MAHAFAANGGGVLMLCVAAAGAIATLAASSFTLGWTHSVEKTQWQEHWAVEAGALRLVQASVEGPGAGIDVPPDAVWDGARWTYAPTLPPLPELVLAASGMTPSPWTLCLPDGSCRSLGVEAGEPVRIWAAPSCEPR